MLSRDFQKLIICLFVAVLAGLVIYGFYCRKKLHSYAGTGKVAEMEVWYFKEVLTWIATFSMFVMAALYY